MTRGGDVGSGPAAGPSECLRGDTLEVSHPLLVRVEEAAVITGLPASLIRKSFIDERKRPANIPAPPPHKRIGRSVYIIRDELAGWVSRLGLESTVMNDDRRRRGRPTVAQRIARAAANDDMQSTPLSAIERSPGKTRR
jgi:hypothetical protein